MDWIIPRNTHLAIRAILESNSRGNTIYIFGVDYYDTEGNLVRNYLESVLLLTHCHQLNTLE